MIKIDGPEIKNISNTKPKQLIIMLHGYGSNGQNLLDLANDFGQSFPDAYFLSPNAPFKYEKGEDFHFSDAYQWFSLTDRSDEFLFQGAKKALPILNDYIDQQLKRFKLEADKLFLLGFSQGTMMSLFSAPRRAEKIAGVIGFSGLLVGASSFAQEIKSKPDTLLVHGDNDEVVDYRFTINTEKFLKQNNFYTESFICKGLGHSINYDGIKKAKEFIRSKI